MSLGWITALVAALAVTLFLLKRAARRQDFEGFSRLHSRRKRRVYAEDIRAAPAPEDDDTPDAGA